jgi:hypothetical protein
MHPTDVCADESRIRLRRIQPMVMGGYLIRVTPTSINTDPWLSVGLLTLVVVG